MERGVWRVTIVGPTIFSFRFVVVAKVNHTLSRCSLSLSETNWHAPSTHAPMHHASSTYAPMHPCTMHPAPMHPCTMHPAPMHHGIKYEYNASTTHGVVAATYIRILCAVQVYSYIVYCIHRIIIIIISL